MQLVERDDEAKNERGVQIAQELINKEKVVAVVGYINTGVALASQRFFQEAKIPVMNNVATGSIVTHQFDDQPENYIFRNAAHDSIQAPMIVEEAITRRGFKKVAILADSTNYGQLGREDLEKALDGQGHQAGRGREVQHQGRGHDGPAAEGQGSRRRSGADLRHRPRARADRQRHDQARLEGADDRQLDACRWPTSSTTPAPAAKARACRRPSSRKPTTPKRKAFIINYLKTFNPKNDRIDSPVSAAQGYDSVYLLAAAIKQAGSTDGPKIKAALEDLKTPVEGVVTTYNKPFTKTDHDAITANIPVFGEVKGQRVVYAYPDDLKKASEVR